MSKMTCEWNAMEAKLMAMIKDFIVVEVNTLFYQAKFSDELVNILASSVICCVLCIVTRHINLILKLYWTARKKMGDNTLTGVG